MNTVIHPGPDAAPKRVDPSEVAPLDDGLGPVAAALRAAAGEEAEAADAQARSWADQVLSRSRLAADAALDSARLEGRTAAQEAGAARLAGARRHGRELVLTARRQAYDTLRSEVIAALAAQLDQPAGRELRSWLAGLVAASARAEAVESTGPDGAWRVAAGSGDERASLDVSALVDQMLGSFAPEIERLWE